MQLDWSREKWNVTWSQREQEYPTYSKKEGKLDWSDLAWEVPSKTRYWREDKMRERSDGKTREKT